MTKNENNDNLDNKTQFDLIIFDEASQILPEHAVGSVLRGKALAPSTYKPVPSAVRDDKEVNKMLAVSSIKGGIKTSKK